MENDRRTIKEVVRALPAQDGEEVAIVRCGDGAYGVTRNGSLMETLRWDNLDESLAFLERFARTSQFDGDGHAPKQSPPL